MEEEVLAGSNDSTKRLLLVSDTHFFHKHRGVDEDIRKVLEYGEKYGCDGLVLGGDISYDVSDIADMYEKDNFGSIVAVKGNHDGWKMDELYEKIREKSEEQDIIIGRDVGWTEGTENDDYLFRMVHDPFELGLESSKISRNEGWEEDILLHGHYHTPYAEIVGEDDTLVIGLGSTYSVNSMPGRDEELHTSFQILGLADGSVSLEVYDFERDILVEESCFRRTGTGFEKVYREEYSIPEYEETGDLDGFIARMMPGL